MFVSSIFHVKNEKCKIGKLISVFFIRQTNVYLLYIIKNILFVGYWIEKWIIGKYTVKSVREGSST